MSKLRYGKRDAGSLNKIKCQYRIILDDLQWSRFYEKKLILKRKKTPFTNESLYQEGDEHDPMICIAVLPPRVQSMRHRVTLRETGKH